MLVLQPRSTRTTVWAVPRSLATTYGITLVFSSSGYLDVSVPRVCAFAPGLQPGRFPYSDICGSKVVCTSPQLFAAYHVLRRLLEPRHPPYALICFLSLLRSFSLLNSQLVNELYVGRLHGQPWSATRSRTGQSPLTGIAKYIMNTEDVSEQKSKLSALKRRYSSRTFRYGYLVTT